LEAELPSWESIASGTMSEKIPPIEESPQTLLTEQMGKAEKESFEEELSPEVIEKIMEKVRDIDTKGLAYHVLFQREKHLKSVLSSGILGQELGGNERKDVTKEWWVKSIRERKKFVHFNIIGRARKDLDDPDIDDYRRQKYSEKTEIGKSYHLKYGGIAFIFDISDYQELSPEFRPGKGVSRTFRSQDPYFYSHRGEEGRTTQEGLSIPQSEYGFVLSYRVPPRLFKGIVLNAERYLTEDEVKNEVEYSRKAYEKYTKPTKGPFDEEKTKQRIIERRVRDKNYEPQQVHQIVGILKEVYQEKKYHPLPIYDVYGNLLWPQKISYEDVKKLVAEREKNKEKK